ncbi:CRISPR-associated ring nuclease Csm6 [Photobacterium toruni]|uniref:CRISPR-associated protein (Cas_NE0113) n=1 Tax=Photobacterium toruni TaxID=1935446 RepID=A0A1T4UGS7_9GAMM|nr:CRISPR-associated ring nuclease Csm6 [Photobacterium toruni]SKA51965.1 CRISPR-associated protein (Cas_NE0113) [Photobacterium toruni]
MKNKKHILLSITGGSPSVLTETLYGIYKNNLTWPDEIQVITTCYGRTQLKHSLLKTNKNGNNVIKQLCEDYHIDSVPTFTLDKNIHVVPDANNKLVDDARSEADQEALADYIVKAVAQLCDDSNNTIHASISGGRKTMTFYLGYAMTLFARKDDMLSHVLLTDSDYEVADFYYPTPYDDAFTRNERRYETTTEFIDVVLSNIPFIRQRELMSKHVLSEFSKTDVLKIKKDTEKKDTAVTMSYADLVTYQSISQTLEQLQQREKIEIAELDKLKKKLSTVQEKRQQLVHDKLQQKADNKAGDIHQLQQTLSEKEKSLLAINADIEKELALFKLDFDLAHKIVVVRYNNQLCKVIDFSNNELELAYYAMIARQSFDHGYKQGKVLDDEKDIIYGYLFLLELLRIQGIDEAKLSTIHENFDDEDNVSVVDCLDLIFNSPVLRQALKPYEKTIDNFFKYSVEGGLFYDADNVDVNSVGIEKSFLRDRKSKLNGLIKKVLSNEFNDIITPTGVWQQDQPVSYYRGRSNPVFSDGLWVQSNLTD